MTVLLSAVAFLFLLTLLILIHEAGHFMAARKAGVVVEEFGFGLPPTGRVLFVSGGTKFTLNWIPFGGFVRLRGELATNASEMNRVGSFHRASLTARLGILMAGVVMNFLLAFILLTVGYSVGRWVPTYLTVADMKDHADRGIISLKLGVLIDQVTSGSPAAKVGVPEQSILLAVDGVSVTTADEVMPLQAGKSRVIYTVLAGKDSAKRETFTVALKDGKAGVALSTFPRELSSPIRGLGTSSLLALREAKVMTSQTLIGIGTLFKSLVRSGRVPEGITGIIGIAQLTYTSVQSGFMTYLRLVAFISLSLAVLNILPFPALDGGRVVFVLVEMITRRPLNRRFENVTNAFGFAVLIALILLITFYDIIRLF